MRNKQTPDIRFAGFSGNWEERKLGDLAEFLKGNGYAKSDLTDEGKPIILYGRLYTKYETVIESVDTYTIEKEKSVISKGNEVIVPASGETSEDISRASVVSEPGIILGGDLNIVRPSDEIEPVFLALTISNGKQQKELTKRAQGKSVVHLHNSDLKEVNLLFPKKEEQTQIGNFFKQLDDTIDLHQQELDTLKQTKQGFFQKLFPQEGESVPEVRFPGFTGDWEQRKFFDNIKNTIDFRGRTPKKLGLKWSENGYLALSALNVKNGYIDPSADAHYGDEELYQKWMGGRELKQGQVLFTTEAPMGNVAQVPDDKGYILSQRTIAFDVDEEKITNDFLSVLLCSPKVFNELSSLSSGGTAKGVSQKSLSQLKVEVPKLLEEQTQIGNFFKQLDDTISLHQRELDALKETKKAFLQKMFV